METSDRCDPTGPLSYQMLMVLDNRDRLRKKEDRHNVTKAMNVKGEGM
ncbi:hypothetical protein T06_1005 [Trichinella sp. T6]|nr:hypothetical protein T06_1005 [Trichinella sp. T6]